MNFRILLFVGVIAFLYYMLKKRANTPRLSLEEARAILGVNEKATKEEIIHAYKKLMTRVHPDKGGNAFLAQQINAAKKLLIKEL